MSALLRVVAILVGTLAALLAVLAALLLLLLFAALFFFALLLLVGILVSHFLSPQNRAVPSPLRIGSTPWEQATLRTGGSLSPGRGGCAPNIIFLRQPTPL